ncbi:uncharacterized protein BX663DRAFT_431655 [Cokeromyces recurvatus]|uniref:uncharacterized protein n=1 Tax=Cokeromyces recurvatus TaxID=90255 RepID=UPI00221F58D1|nr:uncharacterized protein BX663DRAFT_431655 [Cokeromyces recurvatus]KAI7904315.1 hypothetical protein BX663DRAFT_431655 [Cokeromyces recurvatus]
MLEMLQRLEEEQRADIIDADDEDNDDDLMQRFSNIDLDNTDPQLIWDLLSNKEREEFQHMLNHFDQSDIHLPAYTPWWEQENVKWSEEIELPDFRKMTKPETQSSSHWVWNLLHLLGTYSYLMRHTMGELSECPEETISVCEMISENVLYSTAAACPFNNVDDVIADLFNHISQYEDHTQTNKRNQIQYPRYYSLRLLLLEDLSLLLNVCQKAIHDFWKSLNEMITNHKKKKKRNLLAVRKLYFYVAAAAYLIEDRERLKMIQVIIKNEINKTRIEKEGFERDFQAAEDAMKQYQQQQKKKIEEL